MKQLNSISDTSANLLYPIYEGDCIDEEIIDKLGYDISPLVNFQNAVPHCYTIG